VDLRTKLEATMKEKDNLERQTSVVIAELREQVSNFLG
jgi:Trm5-related predicted tRNA methylase